MSQALKDQIITEALNRNDLIGKTIAKFVASEIPDRYGEFHRDASRNIRIEADAHDYFIAQSLCLASLVKAVAHGQDSIAQLIAEAIVIALNPDD